MLELCALWVMSAFEYFHTGRYCDFNFLVENESYASVTTPRVLVLLFSKCILILSNDFAEWKSYFWKNPPTSKFQPWRDKIAPHTTGTIHLNSQKLYISNAISFLLEEGDNDESGKYFVQTQFAFDISKTGFHIDRLALACNVM